MSSPPCGFTVLIYRQIKQSLSNLSQQLYPATTYQQTELEMNEKTNKQRFKKMSVQSMKKLENPKQWEEMDHIEGNDEINKLNSQNQLSSNENKQKKTNRKSRSYRKFTQIQLYQQALIKLRQQDQKYYKPFEKHRLSISMMTAIKMLQDSLTSDKDFVRTLREMGCKTRMRIRNKKAATQLFQVMLTYIQQSSLPAWMKEGHAKLLNKPDKQFDEQFLRMQQEKY